jgi:sugar transport system substrate-binding protein
MDTPPGWKSRLRRLPFVATAAALATGLVLTGCSGANNTQSGGGDQPTTVGALYLDSQGFYGGIKKGIEDGAASENIKLIGQNSAGDATKEAQFMSTLISGGAKAIIMSPVSDTASVPVVRQAKDANIPVVCYNTCVADEAAKGQGLVYALVTTDQTKLGHDVGLTAGEYFKKKGITSPRFAILNCDVYEACRQRKAGFKEAVTSVVPGAQWVADQAGFEPDKATSTATTMLTGDKSIDAFFATTDNGTVGAVQAVNTTGAKGKTVVFGNDISLQLAKYFQSEPDVLIASNGQDPQAMGRESVKQALNAIAGKPVDNYLTTIPTKMFEASKPEQVDEWLKAHADGIP